ncbi:hypothetical protein VOI54_16570 [Tamlana sp. 2201CG12-4]|uniref:hypothetical protein n=1 Tax=Tamlana sp. 2201CG12-4 TaxID=3112582 RepID=UPI002DB77AD4|nr:hypothetical protein [Tamlana sp. 2201CG12-4]MEC3908644.1 hypothetical protein [Tamlana sp. 2201CG12-4]
MNTTILKLILLCLTFSFFGCSSIKVINSWTADHVETLESKNILVIGRTAKQNVRETYEYQIAKQLRSNKLNAIESFKQFPELKPNDSLSKKEIKEIIAKFKNEGFNAIVVSSVIGVENLSKTLVSGGHESGASLSAYSNSNLIGFYGFYSGPIATPEFKGVYEPSTMETLTTKVYVLETVAYNLDLPEKEQLVARITSKIDNVETAHNLAKNYAKAISKSLKEK